MQVSGSAAVLPAQGNQGYCMGFQPYLPVLNCSSGRILVEILGAALTPAVRTQTTDI